MGYAEFGDPGGRPLLFCHAFPGSRLSGALLDSQAKAHGIRVIAADRPGHGLSDFKRWRRVAHWAKDVASLVDTLAVQRFAVLGWSAGGPYAAACAALLPGRITAAGIASGTPPSGAAATGMGRWPRFTAGVARHLPTLRRLVLGRVARKVAKNPTAFVEKMAASLSAADQAIFADSEVKQIFVDDLREAFRQGPRGPASDARAADKRWRFRLEDIRVPVWLWHGQEDRDVPPAMGRYVAERIPGSRAMFYRTEGHISTFVNHVDEMLRTLCEL
jgi:pimeloyl-ACP methyl ester carboxylesterase